VKIGRDWQGNNVKSDCQTKALKEGCCEREGAQTSVSSTEKTNTKRNLARAMAKPTEHDTDSHCMTCQLGGGN